MAWIIYMALMPLLPFLVILFLKRTERKIEIDHDKEARESREQWLLLNFGIKPTDVLSKSATNNFHQGLVDLIDRDRAMSVFHHGGPYEAFDLLRIATTTETEQAKALYQSCLFDSQMQEIIEK